MCGDNDGYDASIDNSQVLHAIYSQLGFHNPAISLGQHRASTQRMVERGKVTSNVRFPFCISISAEFRIMFRDPNILGGRCGCYLTEVLGCGYGSLQVVRGVRNAGAVAGGYRLFLRTNAVVLRQRVTLKESSLPHLR